MIWIILFESFITGKLVFVPFQGSDELQKVRYAETVASGPRLMG
jgi:hypothetical protein